MTSRQRLDERIVASQDGLRPLNDRRACLDALTGLLRRNRDRREEARRRFLVGKVTLASAQSRVLDYRELISRLDATLVQLEYRRLFGLDSLEQIAGRGFDHDQSAP